MAKWSEIWDDKQLDKYWKRWFLRMRRFTPPSEAKPRKKKPEYPHLQPFFKNRKEEKLAA